jgi:hypothetical protein
MRLAKPPFPFMLLNDPIDAAPSEAKTLHRRVPLLKLLLIAPLLQNLH